MMITMERPYTEDESATGIMKSWPDNEAGVGNSNLCTAIPWNKKGKILGELISPATVLSVSCTLEANGAY